MLYVSPIDVIFFRLLGVKDFAFPFNMMRNKLLLYNIFMEKERVRSSLMYFMSKTTEEAVNNFGSFIL